MIKSTLITAALVLTSTVAMADVGSLNSNVNITEVEEGSTSNSYNTQTTVHNAPQGGTVVNNKQATPNGYVTTVPVIASAGTCLGSQGSGVSVAGVGLSNNKTVEDSDCNRRQDTQLEHNMKMQKVKMLNDLGLAPAAVSLMCQDDDVRLALRQSLPEQQYIDLCLVYDIQS